MKHDFTLPNLLLALALTFGLCGFLAQPLDSLAQGTSEQAVPETDADNENPGSSDSDDAAEDEAATQENDPEQSGEGGEGAETETGDEGQSAEGQGAGISGNGQIVIPLRGTGAVVRNGLLEVSPGSLDMGQLQIGETVTKSWTLSHIGDSDSQPVVVSEAELFGQSVREFSTDLNGFLTLLPGDTAYFTVTMTPQTVGDKAAGIRLSVADSTAPYIMLFTGSARLPLTSDLSSSDYNVQFGQALQDSQNSDSFILKNEGESGGPSINVSSIELSGTNPGTFTPNFQPVTLEPGEQYEVVVNMNTAQIGFKSATAKVFHDGNNATLNVLLQGTVTEPQSVPVNFSKSILDTSVEISRGTSIQFGPDDHLYVAEMDGPIHILDVTRKSKNNYSATLIETINLIKNVPNHNDDGTSDFSGKRLLTGIHVTGSASNPVIYAASSDPRQAAGPSGADVNLDTNSGILHKLSKNGGNWSKQDLVRGLPRSEENHVSNGLVKVGNKIYLNVGGHTNEGAPSNNFAELPEYALSAAVLEIDLDEIGGGTYDIPTLNGPADQFDPFGGHDGLNQAKLVENGPIELFATGLRNAYDIVYTESGKFYVWDNGGNTGWGGPPVGNCSNEIDNGGIRSQDGLHLISKGYYAGHPNPTRGNKNNKFGGQTPIEGSARPEECNYLKPGSANGALALNNASTNGLDEYTASNFGGAMQGNLLAVAFDKVLYRIEFNSSGTSVTSKSQLQNNIGQTPLDVTTQGDGDVFPGTIWIVDNIAKTITVLEPADY